MKSTTETNGKTPAVGVCPTASGVGLGVSPTHNVHVNVRKAVEDALVRAVKEKQVKGKRICYGFLGCIDIREMYAHGIPVDVKPSWRKLSENVLISMRVAALTIMRKALEIESILKAHREKLPIDVYRQLILAVSKMRFEALVILKDVDERLFNIEYAIYEVI
jgi:hypothetical protein